MKHNLRLTVEKISARLNLIEPLARKRFFPIETFRLKYLSGEQVSKSDLFSDEGDWQDVSFNSYWGKWKSDFLLRSKFRIPDSLLKEKDVFLYLPLGKSGDIFTHPESLVYIGGEPIASADRHHHEVRVPEKFKNGEEHDLCLHGWTGYSDWPPNPDSALKIFMSPCSVITIDEPTRDFCLTVKLALDIVQNTDENNPVRHNVLNALQNAFTLLETRRLENKQEFYDSVPDALQCLKEELKSAGPPLKVMITATGHAHMDVAYLWRIRQIRLKNIRTYINVLNLMKEFPKFNFSHSQPCLYKYTEEDFPELFADIAERIKQGRWEAMGGMWSETDTNIPGAESLVRQIILGRSYFKEKFGDAETPVLWLPDTFGFSWCLPQLMKLSGLKWFLTSKINWNQYNPMPAQITHWQGLDGSKVLSYFMTVPYKARYLPYPTTYKAEMEVAEVKGCWDNFKQKSEHNNLLMLYGYGDGGGGPNRNMLKKTMMFESLPGLPEVRTGTVNDFFRNLENSTADFPVWNNELYLEAHRGVLTGNGFVKRQNRKNEVLLHNCEFLCVLAGLFDLANYPHADFKKAWELMCVNHFHDIITGTAINEVFEDFAHDHQVIEKIGKENSKKSLELLAGLFDPKTDFIITNPTSFNISSVVELKGVRGNLKNNTDNTFVKTQPTETGVLADFKNIPPYSLTGFSLSNNETETFSSGLYARESGSDILMGNDLMEIQINAEGLISRIYDKEAGREVLAEGECGNRLICYEDRPVDWDAWDIDVFHDDKPDFPVLAEKPMITVSGILRVSVRLKFVYHSSTLCQTISLNRNDKQIDFDTEVDWHENHVLLKTEFPVNILSPSATYDIQWGNIERPTHRNTSWDYAKFETAAHKWADLSEGNYGAAILNDCKYGHQIHENFIRLSLIKSATMPDSKADQGRHFFKYAFLPHTGSWKNGIPAAAYSLNYPLEVYKSPPPDTGNSGNLNEISLVKCDSPNVIIETIKKAENNRGFILRFYENERCRKKIKLIFGVKLKQIFLCNLLEENEKELELSAPDTLDLEIKPYEIISLRCLKN